MDILTLVSTIVLLAFIAWAVARNMGKRHARGRDLADASPGAAAWSDAGGRRRQDSGHDLDASDGNRSDR